MMQVFSYEDVALQFTLDKVEQGYIVTVEYVTSRYGTPWHVTYVKGN